MGRRKQEQQEIMLPSGYRVEAISVKKLNEGVIRSVSSGLFP